MQWFNIANDTAEVLVASVPNAFSLNNLSISSLRHDAMLVRPDAYYGYDPMVVSPELAQDFLNRADSNGMITTAAVASARKDRALMCKRDNPECKFGEAEKRVAFMQAALLLEAFGQGNAISADTHRPSSWMKCFR